MVKYATRIIEFGKFRLDTGKRVLWFSNLVVDLPLKAIEMLCALVEKSGEVVTKEELMAIVWENSFVEEGNLSHHVYLLRKTFKNSGITDNIIQTIPRRGYRFSGEIHENLSQEIVEKQTLTRTTIVEVRDTREGIAVLPFANLSKDLENEYFCDGLAEDLINDLAKIENLKVAARTSCFAFKNQNINITEIGKKLNVNTVLEGSVRKRLNNIWRITAKLINTADGFCLWSEHYDREIGEIFDVQDEIANSIVEALKIRLNVNEKSAIRQRYTENTEVYELYLRGLFYSHQLTGKDLRKSNDYFKQAIEIESTFAPAYAAIALNLGTLWYFGVTSPSEILPEWRQMANKAVEISDSLPEAHYAIATIQFFYDRNWSAAEKSYRRAIELNPNSAEAYWRFGMFLAACGQHKEAVAVAKQAAELDPLSLMVNLYVAVTFWFCNHFAGTLSQARRLIDLNPKFFGGYWMKGIVHKAKGDFANAIEEMEQAVALSRNQSMLSILGDCYGLAGRNKEAETTLKKLLEMKKKQHVAEFNIARVYNGLGDCENAIKWLNLASDNCSGESVFLEAEINVGDGFIWSGSIRQDPRLTELRSKCCPSPFLKNQG
jgi:adenylate cyclase